MQNQSKFFDDLSKLAQGAIGAASSAREEAEASLRAWLDSQMAQMNLVPREDFDAVAEMAEKARTENEALAKRVADLEAQVAELAKAGSTGGKAKTGAATTAKTTATKSTGTAKSAGGGTGAKSGGATKGTSKSSGGQGGDKAGG